MAEKPDPPNDVDIFATLLRVAALNAKQTADALVAVNALVLAMSDRFPELMDLYEKYRRETERTSTDVQTARQGADLLERVGSQALKERAAGRARTDPNTPE